VVQARPARGPRSQVPVPGLLGLPAAEHFGQGCAALPVRTTWDWSGTFVVDVPAVRSTVPLAGAVQVLSTQVDSPALGIGSGVPKLHPVSVQSGPAVLTVGGVDVEPRVQLVPAQLSEKRLIEPSGVGPSATMEPPPPMFRPPQVSVLIRPLDALRVSPQGPPAGERVKSSTVGFVAWFSAASTLVTKSSTLVSSAAVSSVVRHAGFDGGFGGFASSFAKQPLAGSAPPSNLAFALATHSSNFAGSGLVVFLP
jgi:hypothetical protein